MPQAPQWLALVVVSTHASPQRAWPGEHLTLTLPQPLAANAASATSTRDLSNIIFSDIVMLPSRKRRAQAATHASWQTRSVAAIRFAPRARPSETPGTRAGSRRPG